MKNKIFRLERRSRLEICLEVLSRMEQISPHGSSTGRLYFGRIVRFGWRSPYLDTWNYFQIWGYVFAK